MSNAITILFFSAIPVGLIHTLAGPDHYIPFIVLAKARQWSQKRTAIITAFCGFGHVFSALILSLVGVAFGYSLSKITFLANHRNSIAAWVLIIFGFIYFLFGLRKIVKKPSEIDSHHHHKKSWKELTPWLLFIIFVLGPCEQLIPLVMYPAIKGLYLDVFLISLLYGIATIAAMELMVLISLFGAKTIRSKFLEKYGNATAGIIICCTGIVIKFFGL